MSDELDYSTLTPGIRETVRWLRSLGFETTDSGDGVTNVAAGMEGACEFPMVAVRPMSNETARKCAEMLTFALAARGICVDGAKVSLEATTHFRTSIGGVQTDNTVLLTGVDDALSLRQTNGYVRHGRRSVMGARREEALQIFAALMVNTDTALYQGSDRIALTAGKYPEDTPERYNDRLARFAWELAEAFDRVAPPLAGTAKEGSNG